MSSAGIKILVTGKLIDEGLNHLKKSRNLTVEYLPEASGEKLFSAIKEARGLIIRTETKITKELLDHAPKLELICRAGIGVDHIDLEACRKKHIVVMNTPDANRVSAAEHTIGLILALARQTVQATKALKAGQWERDFFTGTEIKNKTLGIIGLGGIGQRVAQFALDFSMKVIACDPYLNAAIPRKLNIKMFSQSELLGQSDFVTVHVPLTNETKGMVDKEFLEKMKKEAFFVNTSRGQVCVEEDLVKALKSHTICGAALDVFKTEPIEKGSELLELENIILTPHTAGQTKESQNNMSLDAATQVRDFFEEGTVNNAILKN